MRYADDLVVFCESKEDAEQAQVDLQDWLMDRGLTLNAEKTSIVHLTAGFDFLGFTARQYPDRASRHGYTLHITPSADSVRRIKARLREEWRNLRGANVDTVVRQLNPIIRGWAEYFRRQVSSKVFHDLDHFMWQRECRYVKQSHPKKSWGWRKRRYWGRFHPKRNNHWVFGSPETGRYLHCFAWFSIKRHVLVRGTASPDDPALQEYWKQRNAHEAHYLLPSKQKLARQQNYLCPQCGDSLFNGEDLHVHHLLPHRNGGQDTYQNLTLRHLYCHQQLHAASLKAESTVG